MITRYIKSKKPIIAIGFYYTSFKCPRLRPSLFYLLFLGFAKLSKRRYTNNTIFHIIIISLYFVISLITFTAIQKISNPISYSPLCFNKGFLLSFMTLLYILLLILQGFCVPILVHRFTIFKINNMLFNLID